MFDTELKVYLKGHKESLKTTKPIFSWKREGDFVYFIDRDTFDRPHYVLAAVPFENIDYICIEECVEKEGRLSE